LRSTRGDNRHAHRSESSAAVLRAISAAIWRQTRACEQQRNQRRRRRYCAWFRRCSHSRHAAVLTISVLRHRLVPAPRARTMRARLCCRSAYTNHRSPRPDDDEVCCPPRVAASESFLNGVAKYADPISTLSPTAFRASSWATCTGAPDLKSSNSTLALQLTSKIWYLRWS
jgi:hypothetical protein